MVSKPDRSSKMSITSVPLSETSIPSSPSDFRAPFSMQMNPYTFFRTHRQRKNKCNGKNRMDGVALASFWFFLGMILTLCAIFLSCWIQRENIFSPTSPSSCKSGESHCDDTNSVNSGNETLECVSPVCVRAAARILNRLNASVEPCKDFYQFTCGNFLAHNDIPDDSFQRSSLQEMQESILVDIKSPYTVH